MDASLRALNRFGMGARAGERERLDDPRGWLRSQLESWAGKLQEETLPSLPEIGEALRRSRPSPDATDEQNARLPRTAFQQIARREAEAALSQRIGSNTPFVERLVAFWTNHLCVSPAGKIVVLPLAGHYERTVIRPHVLGRFADMLLASARHPAMLLYLDNVRSIGPSSRGSRLSARRGRERGLNENYARELLELHTVGVHGGYSQDDVEQLALVFTGWTLSGVGPRARNGESLAFAFRSFLHEPGAKTVLGVRYGEEGIREGEKVIRDLAGRPETARFLSEKLARHFVSDTPPQAAVDRLSRVFMESGGDLKQVALALIDLDEAWKPEHEKFRTPQDWLIAALRLAGLKKAPLAASGVLRELRQPLWGPRAPAGYPDSLKDWGDPDSLMNRAELARSLARRLPPGQLDPQEALTAIEVSENDPLRSLLSDSAVGADERLALALAGPAFQWR